jgi:hypothetical protein
MKVGEWAADPAPRGEGVLQVRKLADGTAAFYFRYSSHDGERVRLPIGTALDLKEARTRAGELSRRYQAGDRDLRAAIDEEARERQRAREASRRAEEVEAIRKAGTVGTLLTLYCDALDARGKSSAREVRGVIALHVERAAPRIWTLPATDFTAEHALDLLAPMVEAGKKRTADKLRSCVRAAYALAIRSRTKADASPKLRALRITANPVADVTPIEGARKARERALSVAELRAYWKRINGLPGVDRALLRFHLLTGCQRIPQIARATVHDVDHDAQAVMLRDPKGRRSTPRLHTVPLLREAQDAIETMRGDDPAGAFLFSTTRGLASASYFVVEARIRSVAQAMVEAGETTEAFTPGDLRRTVETRLAALGVTQDVRAQLQSHGLGGVQTRHYDRHDYLQEKRAALRSLLALVDGRDASVTSLRRKRTA